ncbi:MAG TPA: type I-U CRISPR-associated helicase/endonuclease Cas3 [Candidatus Sulfotelmatobacter sp.]|nr:type I-U CRISPR-associated helicase/endonuclease Cas3 [Candidatus Sulfotelmatobacter sp.]
MPELDFFNKHYETLRPGYMPMKWMRRMFLQLIDGEPPSLVDLPTGAGKTELVVIWLLALAWYGLNRSEREPVPRRLIWVVNRRVLIQQVFNLADELGEKFTSEVGPGLNEVCIGLRSLCKEGNEAVFNVVQLRGQRLDDREWTVDPTVPQLIIGTVDQIGSRILFQGYGLGKWSRPLHAGILGVDSWICVDEAHLVPAFVATLRQVREMASRPVTTDAPECFKTVFEKLPFWLSELSATPGLPKPKFGETFRLEKEKGDEDDDLIKNRLNAKMKRRVLWEPLPDGKKLASALSEKALGLPAVANGGAVAVFCSSANVAEAVAEMIKKRHRGVLLVTGRVRGYERDGMVAGELFKRFRREKDDKLPAFLVGTAAAEVGLDADADAIVCDFAPLPNLVQRLGRLDRAGRISKQSKAGDAPDARPTMIIIGGENGKISAADLKKLAANLSVGTDRREFNADFFSGSSWIPKEGNNEAEADETEGEDGEKEKEILVGDIISSATWRVLSLEDNKAKETTASAEWLSHDFADITSGPVIVPPLTDAVLRRWAATTPPPPGFFPVHPWLYGMLPNGEGTPLVGIAFRLELDVLKHCAVSHEDEEDGNDSNDVKVWKAVRTCLAEFPPLRSELHFVPIEVAREWLSSHKDFTLAHFDGDEWANTVSSYALSSSSILVFPTSTAPDELKTNDNELIPQSTGENDTQRCWDVFDVLAKGGGAKYRREVKGSAFLKTGKDVWRVPDTAVAEETQNSSQTIVSFEIDKSKWKCGRALKFSNGGITFELKYFRPTRSDSDGVELLDPHLQAVAENAKKIAAAIAPENAIFAEVFSSAGQKHDIGKDHTKWQGVMGNTPSWREANGYDENIRVAKPVTENPGNAGGCRHEWGSLWRVKDSGICDLALHIIAAHHGRFRPSMPDNGFIFPPTAIKQNVARLEAIERFASLQSKLGYWRLAYLEALLKNADVLASRDAQAQEVE